MSEAHYTGTFSTSGDGPFKGLCSCGWFGQSYTMREIAQREATAHSLAANASRATSSLVVARIGRSMDEDGGL
jgi:hypothetical protein